METCVSNSSGYIPRSRAAGLLGNQETVSLFSTAGICTIFHSHQQWMRILKSPHFSPTLVMVWFFHFIHSRWESLLFEATLRAGCRAWSSLGCKALDSLSSESSPSLRSHIRAAPGGLHLRQSLSIWAASGYFLSWPCYMEPPAKPLLTLSCESACFLLWLGSYGGIWSLRAKRYLTNAPGASERLSIWEPTRSQVILSDGTTQVTLE